MESTHFPPQLLSQERILTQKRTLPSHTHVKTHFKQQALTSLLSGSSGSDLKQAKRPPLLPWLLLSAALGFACNTGENGISIKQRSCQCDATALSSRRVISSRHLLPSAHPLLSSSAHSPFHSAPCPTLSFIHKSILSSPCVAACGRVVIG